MEIYNIFELFEKYEVQIPIIQREYAQGRPDAIAKTTELIDAIKNRNTNLNFIYGYIEQDSGKFIPVDGQQRITLLWLILYYKTYKFELEETNINLLRKFEYEVRPSTSDFIKHLIDNLDQIKNDDNEEIDKQIKNQSWFSIGWESDATIHSMLKILKVIEEKFNTNEEIQKTLETTTFNFYQIDNIEHGEDLYVKMNSRGKLLTDFENLKSYILELAQERTNSEVENQLGLKFDTTWTDIFFKYRDLDGDDTIDNEITNYIKTVFSYMLSTRAYRDRDNENTDKGYKWIELNENMDLFHIANEVFRNEEDFKEFEFYFDALENLDFDKFFTKDLSSEKVRLFIENIDLFELIISDSEVGNNLKLFFYAFLKLGDNRNVLNLLKLRNLCFNPSIMLRLSNVPNNQKQIDNFVEIENFERLTDTFGYKDSNHRQTFMQEQLDYENSRQDLSLLKFSNHELIKGADFRYKDINYDYLFNQSLDNLKEFNQVLFFNNKDCDVILDEGKIKGLELPYNKNFYTAFAGFLKNANNSKSIQDYVKEYKEELRNSSTFTINDYFVLYDECFNIESLTEHNYKMHGPSKKREQTQVILHAINSDLEQKTPLFDKYSWGYFRNTDDTKRLVNWLDCFFLYSKSMIDNNFVYEEITDNDGNRWYRYKIPINQNEDGIDTENRVEKGRELLKKYISVN